ncbi:MAG: threonine/serine dehydratase [Acidobacteria bacterium]|nr:threonine/serine dehydratase [Acidobacteriota bacterium]
MTDHLVSLDEIRDAAARIRPFARVTPLFEVADTHGDPAPPRPLRLKCENLQRGGAFKIRGAANMLLQLTDEQRARGVVTFSSGNHGIALSLAGRLLGVPAVVVMPTTAPPVKVESARQLGAEIIFEGTTTLQRKLRMEAEAAARGLTIVPPFDHAWIAAGQGTIGLEILEQAPDASAVYVPCSGGGLLAGVATAIKSLAPAVRVIGVEPAGAPRMTQSLRAGHPVTLDRVSGIADGLLAVRPGDITFRHVQAFVDEIVTVDDEQIVDAVRWIFEHASVVAEPSGAASVAAVLSRTPATWSRDGATTSRLAGGPVVAVISGGNVEAGAFGRYITSARRA